MPKVAVILNEVKDLNSTENFGKVFSTGEFRLHFSPFLFKSLPERFLVASLCRNDTKNGWRKANSGGNVTRKDGTRKAVNGKKRGSPERQGSRRTSVPDCLLSTGRPGRVTSVSCLFVSRVPFCYLSSGAAAWIIWDCMAFGRRGDGIVLLFKYYLRL